MAAGAPTPTITAYFDLVGGDSFWTLEDPIKGEIDNPLYVLAGDIATDIANYVNIIHIVRGRQRALDEITVGVATLTLNNHLRTFDPDFAAGDFYGNIVPGKRVTIAANGITIFDGLIDDWNFSYEVSGDSRASFDVVDCLAQLGAGEFDEWTTSAGQLPGARLASILDRDEVQFGFNRDLDSGTSTLQADLVTWGSNVLNYCQLVTRSDVGMLFASKDGVLTFYGRNHTVTGVDAPVFADDGSGIVYSGIAVDSRTELLFNRVSIDAIGFIKQTVIDQDSIDAFGGVVRSMPSPGTLLVDSEQQALDIANYLLNLYKSPTSRFASITVDLHALTLVEQTQILNLDIGSVIRLIYTPNRIAPAIDKFCRVEGIEDIMAPMHHQRVLNLSNLADSFTGQPWILEDDTYGYLDTGPGVLSF